MTGSGGSTGGPRWRLVRAGTDAVPGRVRRFFAARRPRGRGSGRRYGVFAALGAVTLLLVGWLLAGTSLFGVERVEVTGTAILSPAQVREAAAVPDDHPLVRVGTGEVERRVAALPPVARVTVSRSWPDTLVVRVAERTAVAAVPAGDEFLLVDAEGVVFHTVPEQPLDLPAMVLDDPGPGDPATRAALTVLAALTPQLRAELETLTVRGPAGIELALFSGHTVRWGGETESEEKARVVTALLAEPAGEGEPDSGTGRLVPEQAPAPAELAGVEVIDVSAPDVVAIR